MDVDEQCCACEVAGSTWACFPKTVPGEDGQSIVRDLVGDNTATSTPSTSLAIR